MSLFIGKHQFAIVASGILSLTATVFLVLNHDGSLLNPDTAQALSVARNLQLGNGLSTSIIYYEEHYRAAAWPAPQTVFPPGFPVMIAALATLGVPLRVVPFLISVTGFLCGPPLLAIAALRMGRTPLVATLLAAFWLCFPMNWGNILESQTDIVFTALTLCSLILLQRELPTARCLMLSGLFAAAAFTLRYAGLFWLITVGLMFTMQILQRRPHAARQCVNFFVIPAVIVLLLFARNASLVGDIKGGNNNYSGKPFTSAVMAAYYCVSRITGLDQDGLLKGHVAEVLASSGVVSLLICAGICVGRLSRSKSGTRKAYTVTAESAIPLYLIVSIASLIFLDSVTSINLSPRMFFPLIPFAMLGASEVVSRMLATLSEAGVPARTLTRLASALLIAGLLQGQVRSAADVASQLHRFGLVKRIVDQPEQCLCGKVAPVQLMAHARILTNEPHMLGEILERGVVGLTGEEYTSRIWNDAAVLALIHKYRLNQVVVFCGLPTNEQNPFFMSLQRFSVDREIHRPWLKPVFVSSAVRIYAVTNVQAD